jgi:hypothetical protein
MVHSYETRQHPERQPVEPVAVSSLSVQKAATASSRRIIAMLAVLAYGVFFIAAFALPETRGRILHADA